ncbi:hydroxyacid-oxoacid transhydrogenase, mitochondrial-like [Octopus bimaculoides]|uniref:hydroxyacid-oxoacid transhydrogenase, mitochondrial-like n=1 Tax=Octopus bimaculoides TaxID=37653 RepID=UPI00071D0E3A|nr:hydroxyacid-oxoacid transhydrogenase, mitochondrial-like [Octopus bimaculoides]|eukprot:XP_014781117.1 PREDICTED: hydroxyacid-oxoacid transhydrogenase, mitochondrial-like [Octopus bimaculoides]
MVRFYFSREKVSRLMRAVSSKWNIYSPDFVPPRSFQYHGTSSTQPQKEYAFEMACSSVRYGEGATQEVGKDFCNLGSKLICVMTDKNVLKTRAVKVALQSLEDQNLKYKLFTDVKVEPSDESFKTAIDFVKQDNFDAFLAIGGGSAMDTCKAANLYSSDPSADFLDYVNAPIGKGLPITKPVKPLIAIPTTTGTGSETTGTAVFGFDKLKAKTGISNRSLRPTLGILDPLNVVSQPERVVAYSGLDVLCHALESYTALPYYERTPRASSPELRPAYQGSNPISDIWSQAALQVCDKYLQRAVDNQDDLEAISNLQLASSFAAVGFGNSGVHLCHAISYPIAGLARDYQAEGYPTDKPIIPHGLSVIITSPAVFSATAMSCPQRHLNGASFLGVDISNKKASDAGAILSDKLRSICQSLKVPNGLKALGYTEEDIPAMVKGTLPQHRVTKLSPLQQSDEELAETLGDIIKNSMTLY